LLQELLGSANRNIFYVDHVEERGKEFFRPVTEMGLEGMVGKEKSSPYVSGRETSHWLNIPLSKDSNPPNSTLQLAGGKREPSALRGP
jgi:hypothetical protein